MLFNLLEIIASYNASHERRFEIAVHAGEYVDSQKFMDQYDYLNKLLDFGINRLSHGVILWLKPELINPQATTEILAAQTRLLKKLKEKNVHLEICPTANLRMSPLEKISDIPLAKFEKEGIIFSINTDNKTIFETTLKKEWSYFPSNIHNPFETAVNGSKITNLSPKSPRS